MSYTNGFSFDSNDYLLKKEQEKMVDGTAVFKEVKSGKAIYIISEDLYNAILSGYPIVIFSSVSAAKENNSKIVFEVTFSQSGTTQQFNVYDNMYEQVTANNISKYRYYTIKYISGDNKICILNSYKKTARYVTMEDIEDFFLKKGNGALAGFTSYIREMDESTMKIGFVGIVDEFYGLEVQDA